MKCLVVKMYTNEHYKRHEHSNVRTFLCPKISKISYHGKIVARHITLPEQDYY